MLLLKRCTEYDVERDAIYTKISSNEELQSEHVDMVEKLKMSTEVAQNVRLYEVNNSWKFQVEELYKEVVLSSNYEQQLASNIH
ncbi:unnamed protein product [Rhizopus microsporus]|uniref:Uncharacterized protein n=1 Tax=Rhizopus microsporus TaxID=58291 RepID=A0A1X0RUN0_RHIZD|nr:hypothetical protein BCV71DRAFT_266327 [Rhizopus microsporus]